MQINVCVTVKGWSSKVTEMIEQTNYNVTSCRLLDFPPLPPGKGVFSVLLVRNSVQSCFIIRQGQSTVGILLLVAQGH